CQGIQIFPSGPRALRGDPFLSGPRALRGDPSSGAGIAPRAGSRDNSPRMPRATDTHAFETTQPLDRRDRVRAEAVAKIPWWYNPWGHLASPWAAGTGLAAASMALLRTPTARELLAVPIFFVLINSNEWHVHRNVLHRRSWPLEELFWRHTPEHHVI